MTGDPAGIDDPAKWLKERIREVPDFPKPGISYKDITTLLRDPAALREAADRLADRFAGRRIEQVVGIEARGFIFGPLVADRLNAGFVPVRKPGKLPAATARQSYELEYGRDTLEMHLDGVAAGERVAPGRRPAGDGRDGEGGGRPDRVGRRHGRSDRLRCRTDRARRPPPARRLPGG